MKSIEQQRAMGLCVSCGNTPCACQKAEKISMYELRFQKEQESQPERRKNLNKLIKELFDESPKLEALIQTSYDVPQMGPHHNEGMYMDTHLELIISRIDDLAKGIVDPSLSPELRSILLRVGGQGLEEEAKMERVALLKKYALLHDIAKKDCLTLKPFSADDYPKEELPSFEEDTDELARKNPKIAKIKKSLQSSLRAVGEIVLPEKEPIEITWDEWIDMLPKELKTSTDPKALFKFLFDEGFGSISYVQDSARRFHGPEGAKTLHGHGDQDPLLIEAIAKHEKGFTFEVADTQRYDAIYGDLSEEEQDWVIAASYLDQSGSIKREGGTDISSIDRLLIARHNSKTIKKATKEFVAKHQKHFDSEYYKMASVDKALAPLFTKQSKLDSKDAVLKVLNAEFRIVEYDLENVDAVLKDLVDNKGNPVPDTDKARLLELMQDGDYKTLGAEFGRRLGREMMKIRKLQKK
jgi:hypothetical protein